MKKTNFTKLFSRSHFLIWGFLAFGMLSFSGSAFGQCSTISASPSLMNPGFEAGFNDWTHQGNPNGYFIDNVNPKSGAQHVTFRHGGGQPILRQSIAAAAGDIVTGSWDVFVNKPITGNEFVSFQLNFWDANNNFLGAGQKVFDLNAAVLAGGFPQGSYETISFTGAAPASTMRAELFMIFLDQGPPGSGDLEIFVDDATLTSDASLCGETMMFTVDDACNLPFVNIPQLTIDAPCGLISVTNDFNGTDNASDVYPIGTTDVTYTVVDNQGSSTCEFTVEVVDMTPPAVACGGVTNGSFDMAGTEAYGCVNAFDQGFGSDLPGGSGAPMAVMFNGCGFGVLVYRGIPTFDGEEITAGYSGFLPGDWTNSGSIAGIKFEFYNAAGNQVGNTGDIVLWDDQQPTGFWEVRSATTTTPVGVGAVEVVLVPLFVGPGSAVLVDDVFYRNSMNFVEVDNNNANCLAFVDLFDYQATDACGGLVTTSTDAPADNLFPIGTTIVTTTFADQAGNTSSCVQTVVNELIDNGQAPTITCPSNLIIDLGSGECDAFVSWNEPNVSGGCRNQTSGPTNGSTFPIGTTTIDYEGTNATGTVTCSFTVTVNEFPDPITTLTCNDHVQVSLTNDGCTLIGADHLLEGGGYGCYEDYNLSRNPALSIDDCGNSTPQGFVWMNCFDMGRQITVTVTDPVTGNSCWSKVSVEDKLGPVIACSVELTDKAGNVLQTGDVISIDCSIDPADIPAPTATDNCTHIPDVYLKSETITGEACNVLTLTRVYGSTDQEGHDEEAPCTITINITQPDVTFPDDVTWSCQQYDAFNNVADPTEMHPLIIANAADIDAALLCLLPGMGGDDVAGVDPYGPGAYWLDGEDLDVSLDPLYDDDIDNPITDNNGACGNTTTETDELECFANFSYHVINEGWGTDYLRDCDLNPGGHVPNIIRTPNHVRNAPLLSYPNNHQIRGIEDKDVLEVTGSGVPNVALTPNCTFAVTHKDLKVEACAGLGVDGSTFKIIRTWTVLNWCNGQTTSDVQVIKVLDRKTPTIVFGDDYNNELISNQPSSNTDHPDCRSNGLIDVPTIEDDCTGATTIRVYTPVGEATAVMNGGVVVGYEVPSPYLEMGTHPITFEVSDACGNTATTSTNVVVVDGIPPVTVCREVTQIALSAEVDGVTAIPAGHFDEGSFDYCGPVYFKVRRMERFACDRADVDKDDEIRRDQEWFDDEARFCCSDIGTTVNVILRVYDTDLGAGAISTNQTSLQHGTGLNRNYNDCMVEVLVEDKSRPHCVAPADVWTNCNDIRGNVDYENIDDLNDLFGQATASDNCAATIEELAPDVDVDLCGVGTITRTFRATDTYGNRHLGRCEQTIMIMQQTEYTVTIPGDFQEECDDASPQDLEYAEIACDLLAVSQEDKRFYANEDGECMKIIRTWKVINWCEYDGASPVSVIPRLDTNNDGAPGDGNGGSRTPVNHSGPGEWISTGGNLIFTANPLIQIRGGGYYSYEQHIKIYDNTAPALEYNGDTEFCGGDRDEDPCTGEVDIMPSIDELCTDVTVEWSLTAFSDSFGSADFSGTDNLTGRYPLGTHTARFFVSDECGNISEIDITFEIIDCKAPTPVCYNGLSIDVMPLSGMVEIWASDYDASSFDYCHPYELRINRVVDTNNDGVITSDDYQTTVPQFDSVQFTCADAGTFVTVQMWVGEISGDNVNNWDYCVSYMDVQDNNGVCSTSGSKVALGGKIANEEGESVENVSVELNNSMGAMTTDATGDFSFAVPAGGDYSITPMRTDDSANGVSTFDLIKISRHILNVELLDSPYKIIAADANNSGNISTVDLIAVRKVILRVADEFPNNTSWRFVDKSYAFQNAANPLNENFREVVNFNNLAANELTADFVAIKVGDVNGDATPNNVLGVDGRTFNGSLNFNSTDASVKAGETFEVAFTADKDVTGFQFTMDLNSAQLVEIKNGMTADKNFNVVGNQIATSFNTEVATAGQTMFTLVLKATADVTTSNAIAISSAIATAEAYDAAGNMLNIGLDFGTTATNDFALFQNTPNPFKGETVIGFNLPESAAATLTVSDVSGKVLQVVTGDYTKGYNQVSLNSANLSQGVLYYQLDTDNFTATKKMVVIE